MTEYKWRDIHGDSGRLSSDPDDLIISIELHEGKEGYAAHDIPIAEARAIHEALGRALAEVDHRPVTDSISATLAACSAPVPDILRKIDAACGESHLVNVVHGPDGTRVYRTPDQSAPDIIRVHPTGTDDHGSIDLTTGDGLTRYAVQQGPRSLRSISTEELAKLGLKSKAHLPSDGHLLECGHWSIHKQWCTECAADIVAISQRASQPEPPPTGNGASALHPRPFFWDFDDSGFVAVDGTSNYAGIETVEDLLEGTPNALDARESTFANYPGHPPSFGFRLEHTGPRTLREYLEAP